MGLGVAAGAGRVPPDAIEAPGREAIAPTSGGPRLFFGRGAAPGGDRAVGRGHGPRLALYRYLPGLTVISRPDMVNRFPEAGPGDGPVPEMIVQVPHPEPSGSVPR